MRIGLASLVGVVGLFVAANAVLAQEASVPGAAVSEVVAPAAAAVTEAAAAVTEAVQEITIVGKVSVVKDPAGALMAIYINPEMGHGYKVDLTTGEGKTLEDKQGMTVEATGMDQDRLFNIKAVKVLDEAAAPAPAQ